MSTAIVIPANSVDACALIIEEAAGVLKGHAERMMSMAAPDDYKSRIAAALTMDHVKKLAWVHSLIKPPAAPVEKSVNPPVVKPFTCQVCRTSWHPDDITEGGCPACRGLAFSAA